MEEIWRDIPGYDGRYQVSNLGQVRSLPWVTHRRGVEVHLQGRVRAQAINSKGYAAVTLRRNGGTQVREVHRLVAAAFLGPHPGKDFQIRHLDGDTHNNNLSNLRYGSRAQNQLDVYNYRGWHHKLTPAQVGDIRLRLSQGESGRTLAKEYGVTPSAITAIKKKRNFAWLE